MYRCKLDIRIFSEDPLLLADVRNIAPLERFEHEVSGYRSFSPEAVRGSDIIVLDLPVAERPEAVRALCKPGAILVFCMEPEAFAVLRTPSLEAADDIWVKPFHRDFGAVRFKKILAGIKHRKDSRLTQTYLDTIIDSIPDLIWFKDVKGSHLKVNNGFCHAVGKKKEDVQGRGHYYIWDLKKEEYEQGEYICLESDEIVLEERRTCLFDEMVKSKQGMRQFKTYKSPLFDDDGTILGTVGIAHDVTDLANMGAELEIFLRNMPFAILISGNDGRIINVNAKFEEKGLTCRIDHRSYERQGLDLLPTVHEGVAVRQMEAKGIPTDKGDLNRWIKKANNILRDIRKKIAGLTDWIKAIKEELSQPQAPTLAALLTDYYEGRNAGAWSRNARIGNLKGFAEAINFLTERGIATLEDLETHIAAQSERTEAINTSMKAKRDRLNELKELLRLVDLYRDTKPVYDELQGIKWKGKREKFEREHENELRTFHMARRKLDKHRSPAGKIPVHAWEQEQARLHQEYTAEYEQYKPIQDDLRRLQQVKRNADAAIHQQEQTQQKRREVER